MRHSWIVVAVLACCSAPALAQDPGSSEAADRQAIKSTSKSFKDCADLARGGNTAEMRAKLGQLKSNLLQVLAFLSADIREFVEKNICVFIEEVQIPPKGEADTTITSLDNRMGAAKTAADSAASRLRDIVGG